MGKTLIIRPIEPRELDLIINLFQYYKDHAGIPDDQWSENRIIKTLREYCIRPHLFFRAAFVGTRPVGVIGGFISEDPIDEELAATIQFLYLREEHDSLDNYQLLIEQFQQWAQSLKATNIRAIDIGNNIQRLDHIYDQLGFDPIRISIMNKEIS